MDYSEWKKEFEKSFDRVASCMMEATELRNKLIKEIDISVFSNIIDWDGMTEYCETMKYVISQIQFLYTLKLLVYQMNNEKDRFIIQKHLKEFFDQNAFDSVVSNLRTKEFHDYRCIDWKWRAVDAILRIKSILETNFDL